ncbi:hypothetical protein FYJ33_07150 [Clostridiaceae bacterium WCA-383-APC-5B]|uniref:Uncharacterized protein n=2 Tax=Inconstantimicrobium porci TaxID=2652291 RepID=A0A7X2MY08_9CLOT|nr:hypothetical protein [Inconstantimicrobium porci]
MNGAEFMYDLSLNEKGISFKELEKKIYKYACDTACELMKSVLETLDQKLMVERDTKLYRNKGIRKTCVKTIMGDVEYSRRIYEIKQDDGRKVTKYLLDEYLNMDIIGNILVNLTESILNNITEVSYRKTSDNIKNKRLSETVDKIYKNIIPESVLRDVIINTPLSAKKVDAGNNKPDIYPLKTASIPYSSAAVTLGRKVIRNLCGLKDFGDLSYT